ncbi:MAG TPA: hypothetical protein VMT09_05165 [Steroidobacteraceae bacterium]|nr:hypothetical protein [Steroidobacteraceae bacterium]
MSSNAAGLERRAAASEGPWLRTAPWAAPLLTAGLLGLATLLMYANCGAALI